MENQKKVMLSGIQPSGELHLGNYLGAIKNRDARTDEFDCFYPMADTHTTTIRQAPAELRRRTLEQVAQYVACGLGPERNTIFVRSHVHQHVELTWVLEYYTMLGELSRMTQFRDRSAKYTDSINAGLSTYPCLMVVDILLYQPDFVPVGEDQKQHVELTYNVTQRFNHVYNGVLKVSEPYVPEMGVWVMSLNQPDTEMSESIPEGCVLLMDKLEDILRKFKRAITDSDAGRCVRFDRENRPGVSNLMGIYSVVAGRSLEAIEAEFDGKGYGAFKPVAGETVVEVPRPIQEETRHLLSDKTYLGSVYRAGMEKMSYVAEKTLREVYKKIGFLVR